MSVFCDTHTHTHTHTHAERERERDGVRDLRETPETSFPNEDARDIKLFFKYSQSKRAREPPDGSLDAKRRVLPFSNRCRAVVSRSWTPSSSTSRAAHRDLCENSMMCCNSGSPFYLFPSNVCVVPMLAFFVYARFFSPTPEDDGATLLVRLDGVCGFAIVVRETSSLSSPLVVVVKVVLVVDPPALRRRRRRRRGRTLQRRERRERERRKNVLHVSLFREKKETCQSFLLFCDDFSRNLSIKKKLLLLFSSSTLFFTHNQKKKRERERERSTSM